MRLASFIVRRSPELVSCLPSPVREPYREFLRPVVAKLKRTVSTLESALEDLRSPGSSPTFDCNALDPASAYVSNQTLLSELHLLHRSLTSTGLSSLADGLLTDLIRNLSAFGLTLAPLDIRQESTRHTEALDCITRYLGVGSYADWDEPTR